MFGSHGSSDPPIIDFDDISNNSDDSFQFGITDTSDFEERDRESFPTTNAGNTLIDINEETVYGGPNDDSSYLEEACYPKLHLFSQEKDMKYVVQNLRDILYNTSAQQFKVNHSQ